MNMFFKIILDCFSRDSIYMLFPTLWKKRRALAYIWQSYPAVLRPAFDSTYVDPVLHYFDVGWFFTSNSFTICTLK